MASTYTPITTTTISSNTANVTFSSISGTYTDLVLLCSAQGTGAQDLILQFNSDTGSNYSNTRIYSTGSASGSGRGANESSLAVDFYGYVETTNYTVNRINIMNYSNTTTYKSIIARADQANNGTNLSIGLWRNTAAITSIKIFQTGSASFTAGSTFTLYGIKAA